MAANPITSKIYVANINSANVTVMDEQQVLPIPLEAEIAPLAGNMTGSVTPAFNFTATSDFWPFAPNPDNLFFQLDTWQGPWTPATPAGYRAFTGTTAALQPGIHILFAYATDGQDATSTMGSSGVGAGTSPLISNIAAYQFLVSPPNASLAPSTLSFGNQVIDATSEEQAVTLANNSGGPLTIASIAASGDYSVFHNCPSALNAGASCTIWVSFTPTILGADNGTLTVTDDNLGVNGTLQTVSLTGTGVPQAVVSPTSLTFASQTVGTTSAAKPVTFTNNLPTALAFSITFTGANPGDFLETDTCGGSVPAKGMCTLSVKFRPTATGTRKATLNVNDTAIGNPQTVSLTGTGVPQAAVSPTSLTFASQTVGTTSAAKPVTFTNNLPTALAFSITFTGANPGDFLETDTCGGSVPAKGMCTLSVKFKPQAKGTRTATLNVKDTAIGNPQTVSLTGTGK